MVLLDYSFVELSSFFDIFWSLWPQKFGDKPPNELIDHVKSWIDRYPNSAVLHVYLGNISKELYYHQNSCVPLLEPQYYYLRAIEIDPFCSMAYAELATLLDVKAEYALAEECFLHATEIDDNIEFLFGLAKILIQRNKVSDAIELLNNGINDCLQWIDKLKSECACPSDVLLPENAESNVETDEN